MTKLSKNLYLHEVVKSNTAKRHGISNKPNETHLENFKYVANQVFQPLRDAAGTPIYVSSGYRSKKLNKAIGGSKTSHHCLGAALDLDNDNRDTLWNNKQIFHYIKDNLPYTQLISEFPDDDGKPSWVHVALIEGRENEKQVLVAYKKNGKTKYMNYDDYYKKS